MHRNKLTSPTPNRPLMAQNATSLAVVTFASRRRRFRRNEVLELLGKRELDRTSGSGKHEIMLAPGGRRFAARRRPGQPVPAQLALT